MNVQTGSRRRTARQQAEASPTIVPGRWLIASYDRAGWREGAKVMVPLTIAVVIWGLVTGVAMANAGLPLAIGVVFTLFAYAGSAQLAVLPLLVLHTPLPVVWITALLVNLRFVMFSGAMRSYFANLPWRQRFVASYFNGDIGAALFMRRFGSDAERGTDLQRGYFYAIAIINWIAWQISSVAGLLIGSRAPTDWGLELGASLALVAVLIPMLAKVPSAAGALIAAAVAVGGHDLPMHLGLLAGVSSGLAVAFLADAANERRRPQSAGLSAAGVPVAAGSPVGVMGEDDAGRAVGPQDEVRR